jgi:phospho-N-acetylmuramoyl-pentapeptide-transferase
MGGIIILVGAIVGLFAAMPAFTGVLVPKFFAGTWILLIGFAVIGFVDDFVVPRVWKGKRGLGWKQKILLEFGLAGWAAHLYYGAPTLAWGIAFFLILFFSNAYNFADGLDALSGTIWLGLAAGLFLMCGPSSPISMVTLAIAGGTAAFLFLNAPPAKVFMGDVGSLPIGAVLGWCVSIILMPDTKGAIEVDRILPIAIFSFLMIAELVPVPMQVAYFKLTKGKRLFPMTPIHHGFEKKGWPESRVVTAFALTQLLLSLGAASLMR